LVLSIWGGAVQALLQGVRTRKAGAALTREGWKNLTFAREKDGDRRPRAEFGADSEVTGTRAPARKKRSDSPELGRALRSAYQETVEERIPDDLLDLLGKLS
jgi:hypothetical protein